MLKRSVGKPLNYKAKRHTEHDQREDTEVKLQHMCLLVPRQAILGQDSEQFRANGLFCRRVSILAHLVRVEGMVAKTRGYSGCQKMTMDAPPAPLNRSSKRACSVSKERCRICIPSKTSIKILETVPLRALSVRDSEASKPPPQTPPENSTLDLRPLNLLFDRWIMWEKIPPSAVEALGLCRNAISRPQQGSRDERLEGDADPGCETTFVPCIDL